MAINNDNIEQDPSFVRVQYGTTGEFDPNIPIIIGPTAVTQINGLVGPIITFVGGTSGFTFGASVATITLVSPLTTKGDLYTRDGSTGTRLGVGTNGYVLTADSGETTGLKWSPSGTLTDLNVTTITFAATPYSLTDANDVLLVNTTGGNVVVNLQAVATAEQKPYYIKKTDASVNTVTLTANGAETIDGAATQVLSNQYAVLIIIPNNAGEWNVVGIV